MTADEVAAAGSLAQAIVITLGLAYAGLQVREAQRTRRSEAALYIIERINTPTASSRRYELYRLAASAPAQDIDADSIRADCVNDFHVLGYLTRRGLIEEQLVLEMYYGTITRIWLITSEWIQEERRRRGTVYAEHFEWLWQRAKHFIDWERPGLVVRVSGTNLSYVSTGSVPC